MPLDRQLAVAVQSQLRGRFVPLLGRAALAVFFCTAFLWRCATITPEGRKTSRVPLTSTMPFLFAFVPS